MAETAAQKIRVITNCHPGERVGKKVGERIAVEFRQRGHQVEIVPMPDIYEKDGKPVLWYESFAEPGGLARRTIEERALISLDEGTMTVLSHDCEVPSPSDAYLERLDGFERVVLVEVSASLHETSDHDRLAAAEHSLNIFHGTSPLPDTVRAEYIRLESDADDPEVQPRLQPSFISQIADSVEMMARGEGDAFLYLTRKE